MDKTDLTVIVPAHDCAAILPTLLGHLELQSHPSARLETIIVDIGSTDGTPEIAKRYAGGAPIRTQCLSFGIQQGGCALAAAVDAARGRWLLFMHQDLLAGTHLIRTHIRIQERHGGSIVVRGRVDRHPQAARPLNLQPYYLTGRAEPAADVHIRYIDWRMWNLSIPKEAVVRAGGIETSFPYADYVDVHLAWRMQAQGLEGIYHPEATAYAWYVPTLAEERRRAYQRGYCRQLLLQRVHDEETRQRYALNTGPVDAAAHAISDPIWGAIAASALGPLALRTLAARRVLRHDMLRGFRAAGRKPQAPL